MTCDYDEKSLLFLLVCSDEAASGQRAGWPDGFDKKRPTLEIFIPRFFPTFGAKN